MRATSKGRVTTLVTKAIVMVCVPSGRASRSQRGGRGFESHHLHHGNLIGARPTASPRFAYSVLREVAHFDSACYKLFGRILWGFQVPGDVPRQLY